LGNIQNGQGNRRLPAGYGKSPHPAVHQSHPLLQDIIGGIHDPGVNIAELPKGEEIRRMFRILKLEGSCLVDRDRPGPGCGIGFLASMKRQSFNL
jgi:hypothetical protein